MLTGCYYRCPIIIEQGDEEFPRFFVLAQVIEYNELADAVRVKMHDLLGSGVYYGELFQHDVFRAQAITHCKAVVGGTVRSEKGNGIILSKCSDSTDIEKPYWYWVKLNNGKIEKFCETDLEIEYSQMDFEPDKQLRSYEFQHPTWFVNYLKVSKNLHLVNNATYGFKVLAGCRAFLMPHQISTVARCFETEKVRYMLADEVGLGKTVEACSVLSILISENPNFRTIIIVPSSLLSQWKNELHYKYSIEASVANNKSSVCIVPLEEIAQYAFLLNDEWDMAIIDETHRLLKNTNWYNSIQKLSSSVEHILLLSATPIQDRNEEYKRLLALLNPEQYQDMTMERFSWMVSKQKKIQKKINQHLNRLNRYEDYYEIIYDDIKDIVDVLEDRHFNNLVSDIDITSEDKGLDKVKQALAYICENYRLERNVIRNRRQLITENMSQRTLTAVSYRPLSLNENYNEIGAIQNTLAYLSENGEDSEEYIINTAIPLLSSLFSSPWAFEETLNKLKITDGILNESVRSWKLQAENELDLVNVALDEDPDLIKGRILVALNYIDQETDLVSTEEKYVVFTSYNSTMQKFLDAFNKRYQPEGLYAVGFGKGMTREQLENSVYDFQNEIDCRVIVCDETGGEGRNFQNASKVIHIDIPWNANDLEQRIGRLDRLGRDPELDVESVVIYSEETLEEQLFHIWRDGMKLFEQSLSGLEIITGELNNSIVDALMDDYYSGLTNAFDEILDHAEEMRESVEDEQDFDLGATLYRPLTQGIDNILNRYSNDDDSLFASAMIGWGRQAGLNPEKPTSTGLIEFRSNTFAVNAAKQSLFIAPDWDRYKNSTMMIREGKILGTFNRKTAATREDVLFFAPGDAVYDAIIGNSVGCNRGRCCGLGTTADYKYAGLVYIFNIEPKLDELLENSISLQTLSQYKMYLPLEQIVVTMPLTASSKEVPEEKVIETLYSTICRNAEHLGRRSHPYGNASAMERFVMATPPEKWESIIDNYTKRAYKKAQDKMNSESDLDSAKKEMIRVLNGYRAECIFFERDDSIVKKKEKIYSLTLRALKNAKPKLDAVCFLKVVNNGKF